MVIDCIRFLDGSGYCRILANRGNFRLQLSVCIYLIIIIKVRGDKSLAWTTLIEMLFSYDSAHPHHHPAGMLF